MRLYTKTTPNRNNFLSDRFNRRYVSWPKSLTSANHNQQSDQKMPRTTEKANQLRSTGKSIKAIAAELQISPKTVKKYLSAKHHIRGQCLLKARYSSEEPAKEEALRIRITKAIEIHIYNCPHCQGYHISSRKPWFENLRKETSK